MKKLAFGIIIFIVVGALSGCGKNETSSNDEAVVGSDQNSTSIYLTRVDMTEFDNSSDISDIGCGDSVEAVKINKKLSPQEALEELFSYKKYSEEDGLYNVFGSSGDLTVENLLIQNDFAIVTLSEDLNLGGMCDSVRVYAQIDKTLTQFDNIAGVDVFVGDEELSSYLSGRNEDDINP